MIIFDNDEAEYLRWVKDHPTGYVINAEKRGCSIIPFMLHTAKCGHVITKSTQYTIDDDKKICSLDKQELLDWWDKCAHGFDRKFCKDCKP